VKFVEGHSGVAKAQGDVIRLLAQPGIISSRAKTEATIAGARIYLEIKRAGENFAGFVWAGRAQ
jgi:DNA-3-methyladenine glycosylase I